MATWGLTRHIKSLVLILVFLGSAEIIAQSIIAQFGISAESPVSLELDEIPRRVFVLLLAIITAGGHVVPVQGTFYAGMCKREASCQLFSCQLSISRIEAG